MGGPCCTLKRQATVSSACVVAGVGGRRKTRSMHAWCHPLLKAALVPESQAGSGGKDAMSHTERRPP